MLFIHLGLSFDQKLIRNIIYILYYLICDISYYLYIYFIPAIICTSLNVDLINFANILKLPYFCVQFICEEDIAKQVFKLFTICNINNFKYLYRYSIGNVQQIYVYVNDEENVLYTLSIIESICKTKFKNLKFIIDNINNQARIDDYFLFYVIYSTLFIIISKYSNYRFSQNSYLYMITSILMLLNSVIFYSNHICFKYNLVFPNNLYKFKKHFIYLLLMLFIIYIIDTIFIWLNIKKNNLYEKN